jgi:hypothetical protein
MLSWIAPVLLAGMLLFPSTCADAAGVHSLFDDPLVAGTQSGRHPALARYAEHYGMTIAELERHVSMGHIVLPAGVVEPAPPMSQPPVAEIDPCPRAPKFRDMPATMMIDGVTAVTTIVDPDAIIAPVARASRIWPARSLPSSHLADIESPPPRDAA